MNRLMRNKRLEAAGNNGSIAGADLSHSVLTMGIAQKEGLNAIIGIFVRTDNSVFEYCRSPVDRHALRQPAPFFQKP